MNTEEMRQAYPELVISREPLKCRYSLAVPVSFMTGGPYYGTGTIDLKWHPALVPTGVSISTVLAFHRYTFDEKAGGTLNCRLITGAPPGSGRTSGHAHGWALDINPSRNRYEKAVGPIQWGRQTDMSREMIRDIEAIRTNSGHPVWQWGGRWHNVKDAMHFQPSRCTRPQLETGIDWSTVRGWDRWEHGDRHTKVTTLDDARAAMFNQGAALSWEALEAAGESDALLIYLGRMNALAQEFHARLARLEN